MRVRAAVAYEGQPAFSIEELEMSEPGPENILVRMAGCGLCHTDVKAREGGMGVPMPAVLGHEGAGVVERVGARVTKVKPGDHVVLTGDSCGACPTCLGGNPAYCDQMTPLNFADGRIGRARLVQERKRRDSRPLLRAVFVFKLRRHARAKHDSRAQGRAARNSRRARLRRADRRGRDHEFSPSAGGQRDRDLRRGPRGAERRDGSGGVRLLRDRRRRCARIAAGDGETTRCDAHRAGWSSRAASPNEIRKIVAAGLGYAFDTTGRADSNQQAIESLAAKGFFGFCATPPEAPKMSTVMIRGLTIRGIVQGDSVPDTFIPHLIELHMNGRFPFDKLVTKYPFEKINQAIEDQAAGKVVKPVFTFSS